MPSLKPLGQHFIDRVGFAPGASVGFVLPKKDIAVDLMEAIKVPPTDEPKWTISQVFHRDSELFFHCQRRKVVRVEGSEPGKEALDDRMLQVGSLSRLSYGSSDCIQARG